MQIVEKVTFFIYRTFNLKLPCVLFMEDFMFQVVDQSFALQLYVTTLHYNEIVFMEYSGHIQYGRMWYTR